jgi:hypothetical protein
MTTQKQVKWRRERVFDLSSKGLLQAQISELLQVPEYIISKDMKYLRVQSQQNIQHYLDHQLPLEFDKALHSLNYILAHAFAIAEKTEGRDKLAALSLAKDTLAMKLDVLSSTQAVERAYAFVTSYKQQYEQVPTIQNKEYQQ